MSTWATVPEQSLGQASSFTPEASDGRSGSNFRDHQCRDYQTTSVHSDRFDKLSFVQGLGLGRRESERGGSGSDPAAVLDAGGSGCGPLSPLSARDLPRSTDSGPARRPTGDWWRALRLVDACQHCLLLNAASVKKRIGMLRRATKLSSRNSYFSPLYFANGYETKAETV